LTQADVQKITRAHLLLAFYNAFQPGVFALSGWDLVGALTLPAATVRDRLADGDTRWINRGAYDLLGANPKATRSEAGLPKAVALYGPLPEQLKKHDSFASQLARMLKARSDSKLFAARQIDMPAVQAKGLLVLVHELPEAAGLEVTAINFGREPVDETVIIRSAAPGSKAIDVLNPAAAASEVNADASVRFRLDALEGKALQIKR
jgi:trehalose synthase